MNEILQRLQELENTVTKQNELIQTMTTELENLKDQKKELYYQRFLEKHFQASHKVTKYGITDITTEEFHIEIKQWRNFKNCLGQLRCYNHGDNKGLIAAFFGDYKDKQKVIDLFSAEYIFVWELVQTPSGISINKLSNIKKPGSEFEEWLEKNVIRQDNSIIHLRDICYFYTKVTLPKVEKTKLKELVEHWISTKHKDIKHKCQDSKFNSLKYYGWKGLSFNFSL